MSPFTLLGGVQLNASSEFYIFHSVHYDSVTTTWPTNTHIHLCSHTLTNVRQFYMLRMIELMDSCFMQLCTPWCWASKARIM